MNNEHKLLSADALFQTDYALWGLSGVGCDAAMPSCYIHGLVMDLLSITFFLFCSLPYGNCDVCVYLVVCVLVIPPCIPTPSCSCSLRNFEFIAYNELK